MTIGRLLIIQTNLNVLTSILKTNAGEYEPIIIGDFQSFPEDIYDNSPRVNHKRNPISKLLKNFLITNKVKLFDVTNGEGPTKTYRHPSLPNSSYIDHVAVHMETNTQIIKVYHTPSSTIQHK